MPRSILIPALIVSVLVNLGVAGAAAYRTVQAHRENAPLDERLKLDAGQRVRWQALKTSFTRELDAAWRDIARHRERLIREVFSETPDAARIEAERAAIAELQAKQQQRVIAQFLQEREILSAGQRRALAELLLHEPPSAPLERRLHGSAAR